MPKKIYVNRVCLLPDTVPGLNELEQSAYTELVRQLVENNLAPDTPMETVVVAARQKARVESMTRLVAALPSPMVETRGQLKVHPLLAELRQVERAYVDTLNRICLTTCSKGTAKINSGKGVGDNLTTAGFDKMLDELDD